MIATVDCIHYKADKLLWFNVIILLFVMGSLLFGFQTGLSSKKFLIVIDVDEAVVASLFVLDVIGKTIGFFIRRHKERKDYYL